jgi:YidC/Oxa1 family membrane protein insertase
MTVAVRLALLPLTIKQFHSMQSMQRLGPEMKKLQAKYKDDRQRLNQEMMKLYQTHQVNPFGSCLPLVAQMPVFISLFYMLRKDLKLDICGDALRAAGKATGSALQNTSCTQVPDVAGSHHAAQFLFIPDLTASATGGVLVALIIMYIGSQLLSSVLMASATVDKNQRMLMIALPFVFTVFIINFPAGLLVYWITTNLWTVGQQYTLRKLAGNPEPLPSIEDLKAAGGDTEPAMSGFFGKLVGRAAEQQKADTAAGADKGGGKGSAKAITKPAVTRTTAPPPPPRGKKKKRSGRRR